MNSPASRRLPLEKGEGGVNQKPIAEYRSLREVQRPRRCRHYRLAAVSGAVLIVGLVKSQI